MPRKRHKNLEKTLLLFGVELIIEVDADNMYYFYDTDMNLLEVMNKENATAFCNGINFYHSYYGRN